MILRRSSFVHLLAVDGGGALAIHAVSQGRLALTAEAARLAGCFDAPLAIEAALPGLAATHGTDAETLRSCVMMLLDRGILTVQNPAEEQASVATSLQGRDPAAQLDRYRRVASTGAQPYWAVEAPQGVTATAGLRHRLDVLLFGDCDVQMETDFLRQAAARSGIDLRPAAAFAHDAELAGERRHDAIIIGALQARHAIALGDAAQHPGGDPATAYVEAMRGLLTELRAHSAAPILIDGCPSRQCSRSVSPTMGRIATATASAEPIWRWRPWPRPSPMSASWTSPRHWAARARRRCWMTGSSPSPISARPAGCCSARRANWPPCTTNFRTWTLSPAASAAIRIGGRR